MWLFLTRRLRTWLVLSVLVPVAGGVLRRAGETLQHRNGPSGLSSALLKGADLSDRARRGLRGGRRGR
jgi:hypothetical protein